MALILTIIIMLILVAVTIQVAISSGLLSSASKAGKDYKAAAEEEATMNKVNINNKEYNSIEEYVGTKPQEPEKPQLPEGIKVGDYVNYTPEEGTYKVRGDATGYDITTNPQTFTTEIGLKWRILSIDEETGKMELIAEKQTTDQIYLNKAKGYNHGVDILNDMCLDLYSNDLIGAKARSINIEDIQAKTTYDFNSYTSDSDTYGTTKYKMSTYRANNKCPNLYIQELGSTSAGLNATGLKTGSEGLNNRVKNETTGISTYSDPTIDANGGFTDANSSTYATYTYVTFSPKSYFKTDLGVNNLVTGIFNTGTPYWLASRCVVAMPSYATFDLRIVDVLGWVTSTWFFSSTGVTTTMIGLGVRPVVSLPSSIRLTKDTANSTETITTWNIQ